MAKNEKILEVYKYHDAVLILKIIECIVISLFLLCVQFYIRVLATKQFCHPNLRLMLIVQPCAHYCALLLRIVRHICTWKGLMTPRILDIINGCSDGCLVITTLLMLAIAIERIVAMYNVDKYDEMWNPVPTLGIGLTLSVVVYAIITNYLWYNELYIGALYIYTSLTILFLMASTVFSFLPYFCKRAYKIVRLQRDAPMTKRFQTGENLQAAHLLIYLAPYKCVTNTFSLFAYWLLYEQLPPEVVPFYSEFYWYFNVVQASCQMLICLFCHDSLKAELYNLFGKSIRNSENSFEILTLNGEKMMFTAEEQKNIYFSTFQSMWDVELKNDGVEKKERMTNENGKENGLRELKINQVAPTIEEDEVTTKNYNGKGFRRTGHLPPLSPVVGDGTGDDSQHRTCNSSSDSEDVTKNILITVNDRIVSKKESNEDKVDHQLNHSHETSVEIVGSIIRKVVDEQGSKY